MKDARSLDATGSNDVEDSARPFADCLHHFETVSA